MVANNTRAEPVAVNDMRGVGIRLHATIVVAVLEDGSYMLNTGGWDTMTTKSRIRRFSPYQIGTWPTFDVNDRQTGTALCLLTSPYAYSAPRITKCRMCSGTGGYYGGNCWRCKGAGVCDYGNKPQYRRFVDGMIVRDGEVVGVGHATPRNWISEPAVTDAEVREAVGDLMAMSA